MAAASASMPESKEGDTAPPTVDLPTSVTAAEPLVLLPEDIADGLSQL